MEDSRQDNKHQHSSSEGKGRSWKKNRRPRKGRGGGQGSGQSGNQNTKKFQGLNKEELSGIVTSDSHTTPLSHQCDLLFEALITHGGKDSPDVKTALETFKMPPKDCFMPPEPDPAEWTRKGADDKEVEVDCLREAAVKSHASQKSAGVTKFDGCIDDVKKLFSVILGQLNRAIRDDLKMNTDWNTININNNTIELLKILRERCCRETGSRAVPAVDLLNKARNFLNSEQSHHTSAAAFVDATKVKWEVMKALGASLRSEELIKHTLRTTLKDTAWDFDTCEKMAEGSDEKKKVDDAADQIMLATLIVEGSHPELHSKVAQHLRRQCSTGTDGCPLTPNAAHATLDDFKAEIKTQSRTQSNNGNTKDKNNSGKDETKREEKDDDDREPEAQKASLMNATDKSDKDKDGEKDGKTVDAHQMLMAERRKPPEFQRCGFMQHGVPHTNEATSAREREAKFQIDPIPSWEDEAFGDVIATDEGATIPQQTHHVGTHTHTKNAHMFIQEHGGFIDANWILPDSQASCDVICNPDPVSNIGKHPLGHAVALHCNAGKVKINMVADFIGCGTVWFHPKGIANCPSLALVSDKCRVTLDTKIAQAFFVHKDDGSTRRFDRAACDLHACDISNEDAAMLATTTVDGKKKLHSNLDIRRAEAARKPQDTMMHPSLQAFLKMIDNNQILNCPVTRRDVVIAQDICGMNRNTVKGKSVRRQPGHVIEHMSPVPHDILENCKEVTLAIDVFHVNGIKFFRSISRHLMFRITRCVRDAKKGTIVECVRNIKAMHGKRGFLVVQIYGDNEFVPMADAFTERCQVTCHPVARGAHEPDIERDNRTSKERARCTHNAIPFEWIPPRMLIELILAVDCWLNNWCSSGGVSDITPPREIITGIKLDANKHCKFECGDCVLAHNDATNDMKERASDAIHLRTAGSPNGGFCVFDSRTARRVHRHSATPAHMTQTIIDRVHAIAKAQAAPISMVFTDVRNESTILDIETDLDLDDDASDGTHEPDEASVETELTGVVTETDESEDELHIPARTEDPNGDTHDNAPDGGVENANDADTTDEDPQNEDSSDDDSAAQCCHHANQHQDADENGEIPGVDDNGEIPGVDNDGETPGVDDEHDATDPTDDEAGRPTRNRTRTHNKFCGLPGEGSHTSMFTAGFGNAIKHMEVENNKFMFVATTIDNYDTLEASMITPQCTVEKGLKMFGEAGTDAVLKELKQLHDRSVVSPVHIESLTREEIKRALPHLMLLKRKRCGTVEGRGCADGRSQRNFVSKEEASSPTVNQHALFLIAVIAAIEERAVAAVDVPGAFLQTNMPEGEVVHLRIDGAMATSLARSDPKLCNRCLMKTKRGDDAICVKANKAIHGTLRAAPSFWENPSSTLGEWGFTPNPHDSCTMNKMINGHQCAIIWHVDDLMITHKDESAITSVINQLQKKHGKISPLTINRTKAHEHLGMTIDFANPSKVKFTMEDCLTDVIATLPQELQSTKCTTTPAADHLFDVNPEAEKLTETQANVFHHYAAKLLFAAKRSRPDLQTAVAFLCARVKSPDVDDWRKLIRALGCLKETLFLPLILGTDGTGNMHWHVDASFAVHKDMRSHTGAVMTFGHGAAVSMSTEQKINTKSSTEAELVGVDDALPFNIWCAYFLREQGMQDTSQAGTDKCLGHNNILCQDNTSSIKLEVNGKASSTKRTRHINIRFFLVTDKIKQEDMSCVQCVPTAEMLGDYMTKPLQGSLFKKFRNAILGISDADYIAMKVAYDQKHSSKK